MVKKFHKSVCAVKMSKGCKCDILPNNVAAFRLNVFGVKSLFCNNFKSEIKQYCEAKHLGKYLNNILCSKTEVFDDT